MNDLLVLNKVDEQLYHNVFGGTLRKKLPNDEMVCEEFTLFGLTEYILDYPDKEQELLIPLKRYLNQYCADLKIRGLVNQLNHYIDKPTTLSKFEFVIDQFFIFLRNNISLNYDENDNEQSKSLLTFGLLFLLIFRFVPLRVRLSSFFSIDFNDKDYYDSCSLIENVNLSEYSLRILVRLSILHDDAVLNSSVKKFRYVRILHQNLRQIVRRWLINHYKLWFDDLPKNLTPMQQHIRNLISAWI